MRFQSKLKPVELRKNMADIDTRPLPSIYYFHLKTSTLNVNNKVKSHRL